MSDLGLPELLPNLTIVAFLLFASAVPLDRIRPLFLPVFLVVAGRYVAWRIAETLDGPGVTTVDWIFIRVFFAVEIVGYLDAILLLLFLSRRRSNSPLADAFEARLPQLSPAELPAVDIFIPTYDEPIEVLRRSIFAALAIDWPNKTVWVLDDGRRDWLRAFCLRHGARHVVRPDNRHGKAGNLNHALGLTSAPFVAVFDADFAPQRNFLRRVMGLFDDPSVGIVQTPQRFFNPDPLQTNLALQRFLPDEQRFFFEAIAPCRDAWDVAFCCGSNSVLRRAALAPLGGRMPEGSITEDLHLTLALLRHGYVTRYLDEPLALGLAAESLEAFFIQRERWARGAMQCLYLPTGQFGPGLTLFQRIAFLPASWITSYLVAAISIVAPLLLLWFGIIPIANTGPREIIAYQVPVSIAIIGSLQILSQGTYHFVVSTMNNYFCMFRLLPAVLLALVDPFGRRRFRVTPKGSASRGDKPDWLIVGWSLGLVAAFAGGVLFNLSPSLRRISLDALLPVVLVWSLIIGFILSIAALVAVPRPSPRTEERFDMAGEPATVRLGDAAEPATFPLVDLSLTGAALRDPEGRLAIGNRLAIDIRGVPPLSALVVRHEGGVGGLLFLAPDETAQRALVERTLGEGRPPSVAMRLEPGILVLLARQVFGWRG